MRQATCRSAAGLWILLAAVLAAPAAAARGPVTSGPGERQAFPGLVVLKLRERLAPGAFKTGVTALDGILSRHGLQRLEPLRPEGRTAHKLGTTVALERIYFAHYTDGAPPEAVAAELARVDGVEYAEPKWIYTIDVEPNDTSWGTQKPYMDRMHFAQGWDRAKGEQGNVVVAIVDGGTDWRHTDLQTNVWTNPGEIPGNAIDDDNNGFIDDVRGWNFATDTNDPTGVPATPTNAAHGTHTAGIVCAVTQNGAGVAGASWNAKLMPVCTSSPTTDNAIAYGYEGILYAADNGADIINCSWGGLGAASSYEQDLVQYAWESGSTIVAAAGNQNSSQAHYPSAYPHVLSVANVSRFDVKDATSNYGTTVDVSACGQTILSTVPGNGFGFATGTSMSSPMTAGACALVLTKYPGYNPDQVAERVRVTCDNIDQANPSRRGLLGYGRINVEAALSKNTPAVRITQLHLTESDGDGVVEPGETVTLAITVTNFLASCTGLEFRLRENSIHTSALDSVATLGSLDSLQSVQLPVLTLQVSPTAPIQTQVDCSLVITTTAPEYSDRDRFSFTILPTFVNHTASLITTSVTSVGKLGFSVAIGGNGTDGIGFKYNGSPNLLYEAALLIGTGASTVSDAARGPSTSAPIADDDFQTLPGGVPHLLEPGPLAPQQTIAAFDDGLAPSPLQIQVQQYSYEYVDPVHDDYLILRYVIHNAGSTTLTGVRAGWVCDWDVDGASYETNRTDFDASRQLGYAYDSGSGPDLYVGTSVLNPEGATAYRGIWNDGSLGPDWGLYDGFADAEKWQCLSGGIVHPAVGPADISNAIATGPFTIAAGDSIEVGFAFLGGADLPALQVNADAAALKWQHIHSGLAVEIQDLEAVQEGGDVVVRWRTTHESDVAAFRVYRAAEGEAFAPLAPDVALAPERQYAFREPAPAPGSYTYKIGEVGQDGSITLHGGVTIVVGSAAVPVRAFLAPAAPNPFNPSTRLEFGIATAGPMRLDVFDARGRHVRTLAQEAATPGIHRITWDGRDDAGKGVASGVYVARLQTAGTTQTRRMTLLK